MQIEGEINRLNNIIQTQKTTIQVISQQKSQLQNKIQTLTIRVSHLEDMINDDPLTKILSSIDEMNNEKSSFETSKKQIIQKNQTFYEDYNQSVINNFQIYKKQFSMKNKQIQSLTLQISLLEQKLLILTTENTNLKQNIIQQQRKLEREANKKLTIQKQVILQKQKNKKIKAQFDSQAMYFAEEMKKFEQAALVFQQKNIGDRNKIFKECQKQIHKSIQYEETVQNLAQKNKQQGAIMQQMGVELDQRNEELAKLMFLEGPNQKDNLTLQQSSLKITNIFLKKELKKKSEFIKNILVRLKNLDQLNQIEQKQNKKLHKQLNELKQIKQENKKLQRTVERLTIDNSIIQQKLHSLQKWQEEQLNNMYLILLQNQSYHKLMEYQFGTKSYLRQIQMARNKMEKQMLERGRTQKWVSVEELIKMNRKLMQKV